MKLGCNSAKPGGFTAASDPAVYSPPARFLQFVLPSPPGYPANDGVDDLYVAGQPLLIQWGLDADGPSGTFTIVQTSIHPSWWTYPSSSDPVFDPESTADIAVIEIAEDTPEIPEARVELDTIAPGTPVVDVGWGCEESVITPNTHLGRFKAHESTTLPSETALAYVTSISQWPQSESTMTAIMGAYLFTPGRTQDPDTASLCPGDSGGPLYLQDSSDPRVVGVNSNRRS